MVEMLKRAFDRLQQSQKVNLRTFIMDIMGPCIPEPISERVFKSFATLRSSEESVFMTFEDLVAFYFVFKFQEPSDLAQLCF